MAKGLPKNYTFSVAGKTITLTDITTVRLDKLALITDTTTNKILYNFADSTVATATVATNVITLSVLQGGEANSDKLRIDYDIESSDTSAFADAVSPVSAAALPLPTGAATSAKQLPDGHNVVVTSAPTTAVTGTFYQATQPVSGTVTANAGTNLNTSALALDATLTGGTQKAITRGGAKGTTTAADVTSTSQSADRNALDVQIRTSAGVAVDTFGGGTQYADGDARGTATGTLVMGDDGTLIQSITAKTLNTQVDGGDTGLVVNAALHGLTTAGGGSYVDVKVNPSGALTTDASGSTLGANSGVDIGDVTINNAAGASAVNIQDGGNSITIDGSLTNISGTITLPTGAATETTLTAIKDTTGIKKITDALPAGTNLLGKVSIDQTTPGTTNLVAANITQLAGNTISSGVGATGTGTTRIVQANDAGKTILSKGGTAASSGNNTLITAGTNKLKIKAFSLTTTSTSSVTCIFQSGASGTELWRVVLQAPTGVSVGANLVVPAPDYIFSTASATLLNLNLSAAQTIHYSVSYYDEA